MAVEPVNESEQGAGVIAPDVMMGVNWTRELDFRSSNSRGWKRCNGYIRSD